MLFPNTSSIAQNSEIMCLAKGIYFETYQGSIESKKAVGRVLINRRNNNNFPNTFCAIIYQSRQFPWIKSPIRDPNEFYTATKIAQELLEDENSYDPTNGALFFASKLDGYFRYMINTGKFIESADIGGHKFYIWIKDLEIPEYP